MMEENELTPLAEFAWRLYSQLLRAGFERGDAMLFTVEMMRTMFSQAVGK